MFYAMRSGEVVLLAIALIPWGCKVFTSVEAQIAGLVSGFGAIVMVAIYEELRGDSLVLKIALLVALAGWCMHIPEGLWIF